MSKDKRTIGAGEFKAKCLSLLDEVSETRVPLVVTKHGKPVATVVPYVATGPIPLGCMKTGLVVVGDIVGPTGEEWNAEKGD